jgi:hypothetical protein
MSANPQQKPPTAGRGWRSLAPMEIPTTERLAQTLEIALNVTGDARLVELIARARRGFYDDYKSPLANPTVRLVQDLTTVGQTALAERARRGEFEASSEEAAAWARSPEGIETINEVFGIAGR